MNRMDYKGFSTRQFTENAWLLTGCFHMDLYGKQFHTHASAYLLRGSAGSILVDTGHSKDGPRIEAAIREVVGDDLTWVLPTHEEYPHAGNLDALLTAFPKARAVGEVRNYHLYYPHHARDGRFLQLQPGETVDLGDRRVTILPGVVHDLPATAWAYDDGEGLMFVSDAFGFSHRSEDECALMTHELPFTPALEDTKMVLDLALYWSRFADNAELIAGMRDLLARYPTRIVCPGHGNVVTNPADLAALMEASLAAASVTKRPVEAPA